MDKHNAHQCVAPKGSSACDAYKAEGVALNKVADELNEKMAASDAMADRLEAEKAALRKELDALTARRKRFQEKQ